MHRKIAIIIIFVIISILSITLLKLNSTSDEKHSIKVPMANISPAYDRNQKPSWDRENSYLNTVIYNMQGLGPDIFDKYPTGYDFTSTNPAPLKVLIYGDSFLWGNGTTDIYSSMGPRIQDTIDNFTQGRKFKIYYYGKNGDSTFNYADRYGKDFVDKLKPDYIIYAFVFNDLYPNFNEKLICGEKKSCFNNEAFNTPSYLSCIEGKEKNLFTLAVRKLVAPKLDNAANKLIYRFCSSLIPSKNKLNPEYVYAHPLESPWLKQWYQALSQMDKDYKNIPHSFAYLYFREDITKNTVNFEISKLKEYNFQEIPMDKTKYYISHFANIVKGYEPAVNPENGHPSSGMAQMYANDIATHLIKYFNITGANKEFNSNFSYLIPQSLVSYTLPLKSKIETLSSDNSTVSFPYYKDQIASTTIAMVAVEPQTTPCTDLGYPHANIILNRFLNLKKLTISLPQSVKFGYYYYDAEHFMRYKDLGIKKGDFSFDLPFNYGVILTLGNTGVNCDISHRVDLPEYQITIKR